MLDFEQLNALKIRLDAFRPLPPEVVANLHEDLVLRWTYNSNAIEGNTLTLMETKVALEGVTVGGKTLREHFEALNHRDAIAYVEAVVQNDEPFSSRMLRNIHALILKNIDENNAGAWRRYNVTIAGARHVPPDALEQMAAFVRWHEESDHVLHPVELAARAHVDLVKIHPFSDGNGRTARLLMNLDLMRHGFPPVVLPVEKRLDYYTALDTAHVDGDYAPFLRLMTELAEKAFTPYWHALGITIPHAK
ncbi:TPA: Fic family protein [Candidatus Sumerlaeota bacterium]|jgi:Fic family protein|nr:Fic family protein [Candidatus Sumerlaeota bacterium]